MWWDIDNEVTDIEKLSKVLILIYENSYSKVPRKSIDWYTKKLDSVANFRPSCGTYISSYSAVSPKEKWWLYFSDVDQYPRSTF